MMTTSLLPVSLRATIWEEEAVCVFDVHYVVYRHSVSGTDEQLCCNLPALFSCSCTFISEVTSAIQMLMVETPHTTPSTRNTFHVMEHIAHDLTTCSISAQTADRNVLRNCQEPILLLQVIEAQLLLFLHVMGQRNTCHVSFAPADPV